MAGLHLSHFKPFTVKDPPATYAHESRVFDLNVLIQKGNKCDLERIRA
jgi:hypothetical protein